MKKYKHVFFDLDYTLWDFETNSAFALHELYSKFSLSSLGIGSVETFIETYKYHNKLLWNAYQKNEITKDLLKNKRFENTFAELGLHNFEHSIKVEEEYLNLLSSKTVLFPFAKDILEYLSSKYCLHIITNGFAEVQQKKIRASGLNKYFKEIIISEIVGFKKPDVNIFNHSLNTVHGTPSDSIMIGDDLDVDIIGARCAGIDQCFFNYGKVCHDEKVTFEICCLSDLFRIL